MIGLYTIQEGDTIHSIAQSKLEGAHNWVALVEQNNLEYPFINSRIYRESEDTDYSILYIGDTLSIPGMTTTSVVKYGDFESEILGGDIFLGGGEMEPDVYGDLKTSDGIECLKQDLLHRLKTPKGSLPYHPEYGSDFHNFIGTRLTKDNMYKATIELEKTILTDNRVTDVTDTIMTKVQTGYSVQCLVHVMSTRFQWDFKI